VFGKEPATTLNADEACARGCTIMCAIMSPTFKVKEFKIEECQLFPITLSWKGAETEDNELEVFQYFEKIPSSKLLTIYKREPFEIEARYRFPNNIPFGDARIGKFYIGNVTPNQIGENSEIKLKARITKSGIFEISSPQLVETYEVQVSEQDATATETKSPEPQQVSGDVPMEEAPANSGQPTEQAQQPQQPQKKKKTKTTDLPLTAKVAHLTTNEINSFMEHEVSYRMVLTEFIFNCIFYFFFEILACDDTRRSKRE
jgi:molecular chaperone DnaK (HSP70)